MKSITLGLLLVLVIGFNAQSQSKVKERDLKGHWKMVFDFDEDYIEEELEKEEVPWFGRMVAKSVTGFVFNILDEIDIQFEFQPDHRLKILIEIFGEREVEYAHWYINSRGALVLDDDDDDDDVWLFEGDRLVAYEKYHRSLKKQPVYLVRVH